MRSFFITLCLCLTCTTAAMAQSTAISRVVAVVNGEMISSRELDRIANADIIANGLDIKNPAHQSAIIDLRHQILQNLVLEKILGQEATRLGINIPDSAVEGAVANFIAESQLSREEFLRQGALQGITLDMLTQRIRTSMVNQQLIDRMVVNKVVVTDSEVKQYFTEHVNNLPQGQVHMAILVYPANVDAEKISVQLIENPQLFADATRQISIGPNAEAGGDLGFMPIEDVASALVAILSNMEKGQVSPIFDMGVNKAQLMLLDKKASEGASSTPELDSTTYARIEEILRNPRIEARFVEFQEQLRKKALVDVRL